MGISSRHTLGDRSSGVDAFDRSRCIVASRFRAPVPTEAQDVFNAFEKQVDDTIADLVENERLRVTDLTLADPSVLILRDTVVIQTLTIWQGTG